MRRAWSAWTGPGWAELGSAGLRPASTNVLRNSLKAES